MAEWIAALRHPEKEDDVDGIHRGDQSHITEHGEEQAKIIIERAQHFDLDAIVSSDTPRTALLAARIGEAIQRPVETNSLFREWRKPSFMRGLHRSDPAFREASRLMRQHFDEDKRFYDEETKSELHARTEQAKQRLIEYPYQRILLVTHAKFLCGLITSTVWGSLDGFYRGPDATLKLDHTGLTVFVNEPDRRTKERRLMVKTMNDVSHQDIAFFKGISEMFRTN
jgi:broad specificity phosphatase PhoE